MLHTCCAHCAAYTSRYFQEQGYEISAFWYNPNIHPYLEHEERLTALTTLTREINLPFIVADGYDLPEYFRRVAGHEAERCHDCFEMRLTKTAEFALKQGFHAFTTTLLISPHQKHDLLKKVGERLAVEKGIPFLYVDLRKSYSDSRHITRPLNLYRQQYCGCLYSERERYRNFPTREKGT